MSRQGDGGAETVGDVLAALDAVLEQSRASASRVGYFAALYRKVTAKIAEGITSGFFDDAGRMERFDVVFAARYLDALHHFEQGRPTSRCWEFAFRTAGSSCPLIVQHLLLGINAHVNLDLGIAAAETAPGDALPGLRRDFDRINEILAALFEHVERELRTVSPLLGLLDRIGGRHDEEVVRFSLEVARSEAWRFATELAPLPRNAWGGPIGARDARTTHLARVVRNPGWLLSSGLAVIRVAESNDVRRVIEVLNGVPEPDLDVVEARVRAERAVD